MMASEGMAGDLTDEKWRDRQERDRNIDHIIEVIEKWTLSHQAGELEEKGQLMHFPWAAVRRWKMDKKGEMSVLKAWLIIAASLIDDAVILALIFIGLWLFHVEITWWLILIIVVIMVVFIFIMHQAVVPAIRRRKVSGAEGMIGMIGKVTESLNPSGTVKIKGEYWKAKVIKGEIEIG